MASLDLNRLQSTARVAAASVARMRSAVTAEAAALRKGHARIRAAHPELKLVSGRLCLPHDDVMPSDAAAANRELVVAALADAGVEFSVLSSPSAFRHRIGVPASQRTQALEALSARHGGDAIYVQRVRNKPSELGAAVLVDQAGHSGDITRADTIRVTRYYVAREAPFRYGARYGCDLSFYGVDGDRVLLPRVGDPPERVPEAFVRAGVARVGERDVPAAADVGIPVAGMVSFPVDAVYLWVDGDDPSWQARKAAVLTGAPSEEFTPDAIHSSRFRDNDELRYSLRSLEMNAPWIRHIYLVTDAQRPRWLRDDHPRLTVVDHRDIFADPQALPNFNSQAISAQVHHIDGLSEHYLLINDDVFFGRPVKAEAFFHGNGMSQFFLSRHFLDYGIADPDDAAQYTARRNSRLLIEQLFGIVVRTTTRHTPIPQRRSVMTELEERFPEVFAQTTTSRFRDPRDYQIENVLHHWYAYATGRAVLGEIEYSYVGMSDATLAKQLDSLLRNRDADVFCINDGPNNPAPDVRGALASEFLRGYYPVRSSFEA